MIKRKKIAILYIATGPYKMFFMDFYKSSEQYFLDDCDKVYFVYSDEYHDDFKFKNVIYNKIDHNPWPLNTLLRYHYFNKNISQFESFDYMYFFNSNALFLKKFTSDLLPRETDNFLSSIPHPAFINKNPLFYPWERRFGMKCRIPFFYSGVYYQGGFNGGRTKEYIKLIMWCESAITNDLKNNKIAKWHDESYINKYFTMCKPKLLSKNYIWPENFGSNEDAVIIMRDKNKCDWYKSIKK